LLTTDIIVGFPTETDKEFKETSALVNKVKFNSAYIFKYSPRPKTKAEGIIEDLSPDDKEKRHRALLDLQRSISNKLGLKRKHAKK
ncbi:MAG: tRNA (N6-isopentenyl adenosine(37)-C2)-methylthiotransferase MiaB, partial [Candidatus Omnitrophota bacterium]|nr:tRNA (N6-isopentenyl adenosine(37)-C2)-methylthiotransferase MiaB [Candidatus Omnitrophota bacterium]